ncbi:uncharacterized protein LOC132263261 [Phlebotomus argentipes]|uniref:uncharacterized protein LOC132263261 n=1 Tax=Phlebotomus argentipes TaxID=94469 RepID=UPI002892BFC0|nr:uncharacterized protein LOC132263261 [Phlebotomus argentipes]
MSQSSSESQIACSICDGHEHVLENPMARLKEFMRNNVPGYEDGPLCFTCYNVVKKKQNPIPHLASQTSTSSDDTLDTIVNQRTPLSLRPIRVSSQDFLQYGSLLFTAPDTTSTPSESAPMPNSRRMRTADISVVRQLSQDSHQLASRGVSPNDLPRNKAG